MASDVIRPFVLFVWHWVKDYLELLSKILNYRDEDYRSFTDHQQGHSVPVCEVFWLHMGRGSNTLCVQLAKTSAVSWHTFTLFCPSGLCFISCYYQHMDVFIVNSMQVNSSTHISFPPHTLPPLRKASNNLIENISSNRISFKTLG